QRHRSVAGVERPRSQPPEQAGIARQERRRAETGVVQPDREAVEADGYVGGEEEGAVRLPRSWTGGPLCGAWRNTDMSTLDRQPRTNPGSFTPLTGRRIDPGTLVANPPRVNQAPLLSPAP